MYLEYLRKSREDYEYEKNNSEYDTLSRHADRLKMISESSNKQVKSENIYKEVVSGDSISERPQIQKLLIDIENPEVKGVWVIDVQRLCRGDLGDQDKIIKTFKYTNTLILTPEKEYDLNNPADEEFLIDKLSYSRKEYNNIKKRLIEGRMDSIRSGCITNSHPAFGYEKYKLKGRKGFSLKINEEQAEIVRLIFKMCLDGKGTYSIASHLNNLGIKSPKGTAWRKNGIREMLHNYTYAGYCKHQERKYITTVENGKMKKKCIRQKQGDYLMVKGLHEAIICEDDFMLVQEKLKACSTKYVKPNASLQNPLAGILRCNECGNVMSRMPVKQSYYIRKTDGAKVYYKRKEYVRCTKNCKSSKTHVLEYVEVALIKALKEWLVENKKILKDYKRNHDSITTKVINEIEILKKELDKEGKKLTRLQDFLEDGIYDKETYLERSKNIKDNIDNLKRRIEQISQENEQMRMDRIDSMIPKVELCISEYFNLSIKEKNELLHSLVEKVVYKKTKDRNNCDLTLDLYVKI